MKRDMSSIRPSARVMRDSLARHHCGATRGQQSAARLGRRHRRCQSGYVSGRATRPADRDHLRAEHRVRSRRYASRCGIRCSSTCSSRSTRCSCRRACTSPAASPATSRRCTCCRSSPPAPSGARRGAIQVATLSATFYVGIVCAQYLDVSLVPAVVVAPAGVDAAVTRFRAVHRRGQSRRDVHRGTSRWLARGAPAIGASRARRRVLRDRRPARIQRACHRLPDGRARSPPTRVIASSRSIAPPRGSSA